MKRRQPFDNHRNDNEPNKTVSNNHDYHHLNGYTPTDVHTEYTEYVERGDEHPRHKCIRMFEAHDEQCTKKGD